MRYDHEISSSWPSSTVNLCVKSIHLICGFNKKCKKMILPQKLLFMSYGHENSLLWLSSTLNLCLKPIYLIWGFNQKCTQMILSQQPALYDVWKWIFHIVTIFDSKLVCKFWVKLIFLICCFKQNCKRMILPRNLSEVRLWKFFIVAAIDRILCIKFE